MNCTRNVKKVGKITDKGKDFDKWYEEELEERWRKAKHAVSKLKINILWTKDF